MAARFLLFALIASLNLLIQGSMVAAEKQRELEAVLKGNTEFTKNLYQILKNKEQGNLCFSPISIHSILSLTSQGSAGKTLQTFNKVLNISDTKIAAQGYKDLMTGLNSIFDVTLLMANKVYVMKSFDLNDNFKSVATNSYLSEVESVDFSNNVEAAKSINSWVEANTDNKIHDLILPNDLGSPTRLVLINAIYFKGEWGQEFDKKKTVTEKFYLNDVDTVDVQMMKTTSYFHFVESKKLNAKILELPYTNKDFGLIIILPNEKNGLADLEQKLSEADLSTLVESKRKVSVSVSLPKFKIEQSIDLNSPLIEIGLGEIFDRTGNLSKLVDSGNLFVSKVVHKAFIEVSEEGTTAAAATGMVLRGRCLPRAEPPPKVFLANHPFIIMLRIKLETQIVELFSGRVVYPKF